MKPPKPSNEDARIKALQHYRVLDTAPEQSYDAITALASFICECPIALVSLVDSERQWFKSKVGIEASETSRDHSFCAHVVFQSSLMVVEDALADERFSDNPLVTGSPNIRFYAGAPLIAPDGCALGSLCVIDRTPHRLSPEKAAALKHLASLVVTQLELRRVSQELATAAENLKTLNGLLPICCFCKAVRNDGDYWQSVENYITAHSDVILSHGFCPNCAKKNFPDFYQEPDGSKT